MHVADDVLVQEERTAGEEVPQDEKEERAGIRTQRQVGDPRHGH